VNIQKKKSSGYNEASREYIALDTIIISFGNVEGPMFYADDRRLSIVEKTTVLFCVPSRRFMMLR